MRLLESLLLLSNIGLLLYMLICKRKRHTLPEFIGSMIATGILILQYTVEGYRIQLLPVYCTTLVFAIITSYRYVRKGVSLHVPRLLIGIAYTSMAILIVATAGLMYAFPVFRLPVPAGEFKVGTHTFHLVDPNRKEMFGTGGDRQRELMVQIWYPAQASSSQYAPFIPDTAILRYIAENYGLPGFIFQHLKYVSSHAYTDAEVASAQSVYPLLIANPGNGSSRFFHTSQAEQLASHGYIVAVIDHTDNTVATQFPDGRITRNTSDALFSPTHDYKTESQNRDKLGTILTDDVSFVLDQLQSMQSGQIPGVLKGKIDLQHIGVFGHSIGGATAYDAAYDPRITAGIDLDGGLYHLHDRKALDKPFLFINSASNYETIQRVIDNRVYTDEELQQMGSTREWEDAVMKDKQIELERMREAVAAGGQVIYIENTEHLNFTDIQFVSPAFKLIGATGKMDAARADEITTAYMLDFFDNYVKGQKSTGWQKPDQRFPEVKFVNVSSQ